MVTAQQKASPLHLLAQRLAETTPEELPHVTPKLVALLTCGWDGGAVVQHPVRQKGVLEPDLSTSRHRVQTQLSTLLKSKQSQSRWSAVVLIKALLDIGRPEELQQCGSWVRAILGFLGQKTEHPTVLRVSIITLTKIFIVSYSVPSVLREITIPALQPFITHSLDVLVSPKGSEYIITANANVAQSILHAFVLLLPRHPTSFRPHLNNIRKALSHLIVSYSIQFDPLTRKTVSSRQAINGLARHLLALLPVCAPKKGEAEEWSREVDSVIIHIARTADHIFRAVEESPPPLFDQSAYVGSLRDYRMVVNDSVSDFLQLPPWIGIYAGCERLVECLHVLESYLSTKSQVSHVVPVSAVCELAERLISVYAPFTTAGGEDVSLNFNPEVERKERDGLFTQLPYIHQAALRLLIVLLRRIGSVAISIADFTLGMITLIFERGSYNKGSRSWYYEAVADIVALIGPGMRKETITTLQPLLVTACKDAQPPTLHEEQLQPNEAAAIAASNYSRQGPRSSKDTEYAAELHLGHLNSISGSALRLLRLFLGEVPSELSSPALRSSIDQAIILARDRDAMLASVINPAHHATNGHRSTSNLPFLARAFPNTEAVEALIRPRVPAIYDDRRAQAESELHSRSIIPISRARNIQDSFDHESQVPPPITIPGRSMTATSTSVADQSLEAVLDVSKEFVQSPKRPRDSASYLDAEITTPELAEPQLKRLKESSGDEIPFESRNEIDHAEQPVEHNSDKQTSTSLAPGNKGEHNEDDDYEIPPIHMLSDDGDSELEDSE